MHIICNQNNFVEFWIPKAIFDEWESGQKLRIKMGENVVEMVNQLRNGWKSGQKRDRKIGRMRDKKLDEKEFDEMDE